jgi:DNA-binding MarR family transcriptional regulator
MNPAALSHLPEAARSLFIQAFTTSLGFVFLVAAGMTALAFVIALFLPQRPLRGGVAAGSGIGQSFAVPQDEDSLTQVSRSLWALLSRESKRRLLERIVTRAGVDLSPAAAWLLARFDESSEATPEDLARTYGIEAGRLAEALGELRSKGLVAEESQALTPAGREVLERLRAARRAGLSELLADWAPEQPRDLAEFLRRVAGDLAREAPT